MNCPYCKALMRDGYLQSARAIMWDPKLSAGMVMPYSEGSFYVVNNYIKPNAIKSYFCDTCHVLITSLGKEKI